MINCTMTMFASGQGKYQAGKLLLRIIIRTSIKMYSIKRSDGKCKKTGKGILTAVKEKDISHENYKECLFERRQMGHPMIKIIQKEHQLHTATQVNTSLSPFNDKKYFVENLKSVSFGHKNIEKIKKWDSLSYMEVETDSEESVDCLDDLINTGYIYE